jgi:cyclophilin family peptidyl-prolyl cis-trans isomerase/protein-disulfide isomerase
VLIVLLALSACTPAAQPTAPQATQTPTRPPLQAATHEPGCTVVSREPKPTPASAALIPAVGPRDWTLGPASAKLTLIVYSDFQCPGCAFVAPVMKRLVERYPQDVRLVFRLFPLITLYDKSALADQAAEAAGLQGKFWEMHDLLFGRRTEWVQFAVSDSKGKAQFEEWLAARAGELGLDVDEFKKDLNSASLVELIQQAWENNSKFIPGAPYILINGEPYEGPMDFQNLNATLALMLLEGKQFTDCPPITINPTKQYTAILHTSKGDLTLELYADRAPLAVNSFIFLARKGWFDGVTFHRVIPGFVAQAGDPTGTGVGGPGYAFDNEISPDLTFDRPGVLGMANAGPGSNGSQFFITYTAVPRLNGGYTIFGQLISGMDVLEKLTPRDPSQSMDLPPGDAITSVTIIEK